jgi:ribosomal protein S18 acetylase RimI-like enzyme
MKIRELKRKEIKPWIELVQLADNRDEEWAKQRFDSFVSSRKKKKLLVVEEKSNLIGFVGIKGEGLEENVKPELNKEYMEINWIAIVPKFRNKGFGSKLLIECEKYARKWKKKGIWLGCRDEIIPFYKKYGYKEEGTFINYKNKPENLMVKKFK